VVTGCTYGCGCTARYTFAEAISSALGGWQRRVDAASGGPSASFSELIDSYLNTVHRNNPGTGCAFSALAPEIARSDKKTRALTSEQVRNDLELIAGLLLGKDKRAARSRAMQSDGEGQSTVAAAGLERTAKGKASRRLEEQAAWPVKSMVLSRGVLCLET
jgi:TetR/AcrR family transcriptional repressor of nem operon